MPLDLAIVLVSYNTRPLTLACLRSIYMQTRSVNYEVIIVDNASSDGSANAIAAEFPQARLLQPGRNLGFAAANNLAAEEATGEWLLLINPDTLVLDRAVDRLMEFARAHPEASIFGGRTVFGDGLLNPASCWRRPTPWSVLCAASGVTSIFSKSDVFARESYGTWRRDSVREVDIVSGCFLLIRRHVWEELGGFDPAFFMYGEEADLCLRAKQLGHKCLICPDAMIVHYGGASEKVRADKMVRLFIAKAMLFSRHWGRRVQPLGMLMLDLWALSRLCAFSILRMARLCGDEPVETWRSIWRRRSEWRHALAACPPIGSRTNHVSALSH